MSEQRSEKYSDEYIEWLEELAEIKAQQMLDSWWCEIGDWDNLIEEYELEEEDISNVQDNIKVEFTVKYIGD